MNNRLYVTDEETLYSFVCAICYNYLTVGPVGITASKKICGRCSQTYTTTVMLDDTYFSNKLFPCVNRFSGCRQLLTHSQMIKHEQICLTQEDSENKCLLCPFSGNVCQVYNHVRTMHDKVLIDTINPQSISFQLAANMIDRRLIRMGNFVFAVRAEYNDQQIGFKIMLYGEKNRRKSMKYKLRLQNSQHRDKIHEFSVGTCFVAGNLNYEEEKPENLILKKPVKALNLENDDPILCFLEFNGNFEKDLSYVDITDFQNDAKNKPTSSDISNNQQPISSVEQQLEISQSQGATKSKADENASDSRINSLATLISKLFRCSNCTTISMEELFWCPKHHVKCEECISHFCVLCDDVTNYTIVDDGRHMLLHYVQLPCRWNASHLCDKHLLRQHEYFCPDRLYHCPLLCDWKGKLAQLKAHWHSQRDLIICNYVEIDSFQEENVCTYVISDSDCLYCEVSKELVSKSFGYKYRSYHVRHTSILGSTASKLKVILTLKSLNVSSEKFQAASIEFPLGIRKLYKVPTSQYYKIKIEFSKAT